MKLGKLLVFRKMTAFLCLGSLALLIASPALGQMKVKTGSYSGDGQDDRALTGIGFAPDLVLIKGSSGSTVVRTATMVGDISKTLGTGSSPNGGEIKSLDGDGFTVGTHSQVNQSSVTYYWVAFQADPAEMVVGSFTGDGSDNRSISGVGFQPDYLLVMNESGHQASQRFPSQIGDASRQFDLGGETSNRIQAFEADGFQLGSNNSVNESGKTIHYAAWNLTPGRVAGDTYNGNGNDNRNISNVGHQPLYVILADSPGNIVPIQRSASISGDASLPVGGGGPFSNGIQAFQTNGFQVGSHLATNATATRYYWVAFGQAQSVDLAVTKSVDVPAPIEGGTVTYTVIVSNPGSSPATGVQVSDPLPSGLTHVSSSPTQGIYDSGSGGWTVGNLAPGDSDTLWITATVDAGTGGSTITNTATLSALDQTDSNSANDSDSADIQVQTALGFSVSSGIQSFADVFPGQAPLEVFRLSVTNTSTQTGNFTGLTVGNKVTGPGSPAELDAEWTALSLFDDNGGFPALLGTAPMAAGSASFSGFSVAIPPAGTRTFFVQGAPSLTARDGDLLDLHITGPGELSFFGSPTVTGVWPVDPAGHFVVDGMSAAQIVVNPVLGRTLSQGARRELVLDVIIPANGYAPDTLNRFNVINHGSAEAGIDIAQLLLWVDGGQSGFDPAQDLLLGSLENTGNRWEITGLQTVIPASGLRVFISADVSDLAPRTSSIQLGIPTGPDLGVGVASGNSGPVDAEVANDQIIIVTNQNRVVFAANSIAPGTTRPGDENTLLLHVTASNTYPVVKTLTDLAVTNTSLGPGTVSELDQAIQLLTLYRDSDDDGAFDPGLDSALGSGVFLSGSVEFTNLLVDLNPGETEHLFLVARVSMGARDDDRLSARLQGPLDLGFSDPTSAAAVWPVDSGAMWTVDGMVGDQITVVDGGKVTLGPGDGPVSAFEFVIPANGYQSDVLFSLRILEYGDAAFGDLTDVRLWQDGGNGTFDSSLGDDTDLGGMTALGGAWQAVGLSAPIGLGGARFFVSVSVSPTFTDSAQVSMAIPINGITMASSNDGPLDREVVSGHLVCLSDAPLLARITFSSPVSTLGQLVSIRMVVENRSNETVNNILPSSLLGGGSGILTEISGPIPGVFSLAPAAQDTFAWVFRADGSGSATLTGNASGTGAVSGEVLGTRLTSSVPHTIFTEAQELQVSALDLMPSSITIGQTAVVPLNLTFTNPGGAGTSTVRLARLRVRLEDELGNGIVPADLLSRVVLSEGLDVFQDKTAMETAGAQVDLPLGGPFPDIRVSTSDPVTLSLQLYLSPTTTVPRFRVVILDSTRIDGEDAISANPVQVSLKAGAFPVVTRVATIVGTASQVTVTGIPPQTLPVGPGQNDVDLLSFTMENLGTGLSAARVGEFAVTLIDSSGSALPTATRALKQLQVRALGQTVYSEGVVSGSGDSLVLTLSPPIVLLENTQVTVAVTGSISDTAAAQAFRLGLREESSIDVRDGNTGDLIPVFYPVSPVMGNTIQIQDPAEEVLVGGTPLLPATVTVGNGDISALEIVLQHPGSPVAAPIRMDSLLIHVRDDQGQTLNPATFLSRIRILWDGTEVVDLLSLPGGNQPIVVNLPSLLIDPGQSATATVVLDIAPGAPLSPLQLVLNGTGIRGVDANLDQPVAVTAQPGANLPLVSGVTQLVVPSREVRIGLQSLMPAALEQGGGEVIAGTVTFSNPTAQGASPIRVRHLNIHGADRDLTPMDVGKVASLISVFVDGALFAQSDTLSTDSTMAWVEFSTELIIPAEEERSLEIRMLIRDNTAAGSFRLGYDGPDIGVVQPSSALLALAVRPETGQSFPMWTEAGTFAPTTLRGSYSNFPNPFAAGREETAFVYYLPQDGKVSLNLWTVRGEKVATVIDGALRSAGLHQSDRWQGRNSQGVKVINGVYIAELRVQFRDGSTERVLRKVAVVR